MNSKSESSSFEKALLQVKNFSFSQQARQSDQLPEARIAAYLQLHLADFMQFEKLDIQQFSGGASNLTYCLSNGKQSIIIRRPPSGTKAKSAHNMVREFNLLDKIGKFYHLSPKPIFLCEDKNIIGDDFFLMQKINGLGINKSLPVPFTDQQQRSLCENFVDGLIGLHSIDIITPQLAELGKPQGYVERQLEGWQSRFLKAKTEDVVSSGSLYQWLKKNLPFDSGFHSLIHNDYKFDNLILDESQPDKIIGVLDWEMTTLGDPLVDLGCSLAYWVEADDPEGMQAIRMMPTHLSGMMTREQIFSSYCKKRHITNVELKPYYIFGLFRLAVIAQQIYYRFYHGQTDNPKFKNFAQLVNILIEYATQQIDLP